MDKERKIPILFVVVVFFVCVILSYSAGRQTGFYEGLNHVGTTERQIMEHASSFPAEGP